MLITVNMIWKRLLPFILPTYKTYRIFLVELETKLQLKKYEDLADFIRDVIVYTSGKKKKDIVYIKDLLLYDDVHFLLLSPPKSKVLIKGL